MEKQKLLGYSKEQIISQLGKPLKTTTRDEMNILWYTSIAPSRADLFYFQNNKLVYKSLYVNKEARTLQDYIQTNGLPEKSVYFSKQPEYDSFQQVVHIWSSKGEAVVSRGTESNSPIERRYEFEPMNLTTYFATAGKQFTGNTEATVSGILQTARTEITTEKKKETNSMVSFEYIKQHGIVFTIGTLVLVTITIFVVYLWYRRRKLPSFNNL